MRTWVPLLLLTAGMLSAAPSAFAQVLFGEADEAEEASAAESWKTSEDELVGEDPLLQLDLGQTVIVVPFAGVDADSEGLASLMEQFVLDGLAWREDLTVSSLAEAPPVEDVDAALYYEGCPKTNELGCQLVLGELAEVDRVVAGVLSIPEEGGYRVKVTILNIRDAMIELSYTIDLVPGEEELLPQTVAIGLRELQMEEALAPLRAENAEQAEAREAQRLAILKAASEAELELIARMVVDVDVSSIEEAELEMRKHRRPKVSRADIESIKERQGAIREWESLGLTESQYLSYTNSGLDLEPWRWRWAGHRLQLLGSFQIGLVGGSTGLKYYGIYLRNLQLTRRGIPHLVKVDSHSWQVVQDGQGLCLGGSIGLGVLRNLDVEVGFWWARSTVEVKLVNGEAREDQDSGELVPFEVREPLDFFSQTLSLWGGEVMARFFFLTVFPVRPSLGAGVAWASYPTLYNDPDVPDEEEVPAPAIPADYETFNRLVDVGVQIEPGVTVDIGRNFGVFLRVPIMIGLHGGRVRTSNELPRPIIDNPAAVPDPPFGTIRVVLGVQGRVFGWPVQFNDGGHDEDILDEDE